MDPEILDQLIRQAAAGGGGAGAVSSADDPPVYVGRTTQAPRSRFIGKDLPGPDIKAPRPAEDITLPLSEAVNEIHRMSAREQNKFADLLEKYGILEPGNYSYEDLVAAWQAAAEGASNLYHFGKKKVTPEQYVPLMATGMGAQSPEFGGVSRSRSTNTSTSTSRSSQTNLTTKADSRALITDAFRAELGRDPSRKEARAFYRALNSAERRNPSVSTGESTQTTVSRDRNRTSGTQGDSVNRSRSSTTQDSNSSSVTRGGVTPTSFAQNFIDDEYDNEQDARNSATIYYDALLNLAGGGG